MQLLQEGSRPRRPRWLRRLLFFGAALAAAAAVLLFEPAERSWRRWRADRTLRFAQRFARAGDNGNAMLAVQAAAQSTTFDPAQLRIVAEVLHSAGSPDALTVYRRLAEIDATDLDARENGIRTALQSGDVGSAESLLASLDPAQRTGPRAARLTADVAAASGRATEREHALVALLAHSPGDSRARFELASLQLSHPAQAGSARQTLHELANSSATERIAARELLARDAVQRKQPLEAVRWADAAATDADARFRDRLFQLEIHHELAAPGEPRLLRALQSSAASSPDDAASLATWMLLHDDATVVTQWLDSLPATTRNAAVIRQVRVDAAVIRGDWSDVAAKLHAGAWGTLNGEAVDRAMHACRLRHAGQGEASAETWRAAIARAGDLPTLRALYRLALVSGGAEEIDATLRAIARATPGQHWALQLLAQRAYRRGDTARLCDVYALWLELDPADERAVADWAMATLLSEPKVATLVEQRTRALHDRDPQNPHLAAVRAFCLWRTGRPSDALAILDALSPEQRAVPGRALIYAAVLTALHRYSDAAPYLAFARGAPMLPEESAILRELERTGQARSNVTAR